VRIVLRVEKSNFDHELCICTIFSNVAYENDTFITQFKFSSLVSLLSPFASLVVQTPIFLTKFGDESIIFISDVGKTNFFKNIRSFQHQMH
jgi:hypothetical protein